MARAVGPVAGLNQMKALLALEARFQHLAQTSCPTIVIGGSEDRRTTPAAHEALAREIPGSSLVMIADAAHFTPLEQPRKVSEALQHWMTGSECLTEGWLLRWQPAGLDAATTSQV